MKKFLPPVSFLLIMLFSGCPDAGTNITLGPLDPNLVGSVWEGETPRAGDWLTIEFKAGGKVIFSFKIDNSANEWEYTFDKSTNTGTIIVNPEDPWNPAPDGFTVNGDTLTITNYGFHGGAPRDFKRYR